MSAKNEKNFTKNVIFFTLPDTPHAHVLQFWETGVS